MKKRLHEKYFSIVIAMWYKTNNRSTISFYPSNTTNIQIIGIETLNVKIIPYALSRFLELNLTPLPQLRLSLHKILLL